MYSKHFKREEFACKGQKKGICECNFDTVDAETLEVLEQIRFHFDKPVTIYSGCRCKEYNKHVGGSKQSQHMKGRAVDIGVKDVSPEKVHEYLIGKYPDKYGIGKYRTFVHIDTRNYKARW